MKGLNLVKKRLQRLRPRKPAKFALNYYCHGVLVESLNQDGLIYRFEGDMEEERKERGLELDSFKRLIGPEPPLDESPESADPSETRDGITVVR